MVVEPPNADAIPRNFTTEPAFFPMLPLARVASALSDSQMCERNNYLKAVNAITI
jgi:hypothetical protein